MGDQMILRARGAHIGLDVLGGEIAYISHAHSDHSEAVGGPLRIFCTDPTADLLGITYADGRDGNGLDRTGMGGPKDGNKENGTADGPGSEGENGGGADRRGAGASGAPDPFELVPPARDAGPKAARRPKVKKDLHQRTDVPENIRLHNAGHMLGSAQIEAQSETEGNVVYTGDFKLRDGLSVKGASAIGCQTLIIECTYGDPRVSFPDPCEVLSDMERWSRQHADSIQIWGGYSTGKAQEVVKFLNGYMDTVPVVSRRIAQVCEAYGRHGVKLEWLESSSPEAQEAMRDPFCAVLPPHLIRHNLAGKLARVHARKALTAFPTGWALVRDVGADAAFPLSDHADFGEILGYAQESGAKRIYTAHGDNENTAKALRAAGLDAWPIEKRTGQQTLIEALAGGGAPSGF